MKNLFNQVMFNKPKKNVFDLGHERKFSMNMGELVPILCEEVVPGDNFKMNTETMLRLAPLTAPVMHQVNVYTHFFFVPNRLTWNNWENFITGGENGSADPVIPYYNIPEADVPTYMGTGTLADYLGTATADEAQVGATTALNAMPFRAYQTIFNEYYRDQNLEDKVDIETTSGESDHTTSMQLQTRAWEKDYFTSALPFTQKGGAVNLPMAGTANLSFDATDLAGKQQKVYLEDGSQSDQDQALTGYSNNGVEETRVSTNFPAENAFIDVSTTTTADMTSVTSATVEELRRATKLQQWLERNARGGSRYIESILAHFGVKSSDARLQRPEYLGGGKSPVVISEVLQNSSTDNETPQGNMAGHGVAVGNTHSFNKKFEEHGYVIGIMSVLPRTAYMQGTRRHFYKNDKFDYFWPEFAQVGEQEVLQGELYSSFDLDTDRTVFGYQSRYSDYKYIPSSVHGDFKTTNVHWHMARTFDASPNLNSSFIKSDPTHRVFAVTDETINKLYVQVYNNLKAIRPMPYFNIPQL